MENCVAPGLDKFQSIIRSCIVFGQSTNSEVFWYLGYWDTNLEGVIPVSCNTLVNWQQDQTDSVVITLIQKFCHIRQYCRVFKEHKFES